MTDINKYVGRSKELLEVEKAIHSSSRGTELYFVSGPSGVGKSRFLFEVKYLYSRVKDLIVTNSLDCYETSAHIPFSIELHLANQLQENFGEFRESITRWFKNKLLGGESTADSAISAVRESFLNDYNRLAQSKRIVVCFDTVEAALRSDLWERIIELIPYLENTVVLIAGKEFGLPADEIQERLDNYNLSISHISLKGLDASEVNEFMAERNENIEAQLVLSEKIGKLTDGRPVLLILANEWLHRSMHLEFLEETSIEKLESLTPVELQELRERVENALVAGILKLADPVDKAILQMSWIYRRFDIHILSSLLDATLLEEESLLEKLRELPFTRILPDGVCVLHDNVRDLVIKHVWPIVDPNGTYRLALDRKIVKYYDQLIANLLERIASLRTEIFSLVEGYALEKKQKVFEELIELETKRWVFEAERLFYQLRSSPHKGVDSFIHAFDDASEGHRDLRELLVFEIIEWQHRPHRPSGEENFEINLRLARRDLEAANIDKAYNQFETLLGHQDALGANRIDILLNLCNASVRLGKVERATEFLKKAYELSLREKDAYLIARCEYSLGWLSRLKGDWSLAAQYYHDALKRVSLITDTKKHTGLELQLEIDQAYIMHLLGKNEKAEVHAKRALSIWKRFNVSFQLGIIYSTLGEIMNGQDRYAEGWKYYNEALSLFQESRAWEWQVIVYRQLAYSSWCHRDLEKAWKNLLTSRKLATQRNITIELPAIFLTYGLLVLDEYGDFEEAAKHFERGVRESKHNHNGIYLVENMVALVEISYLLHDRESMIERAAQVKREIEQGGFDFPLIEGRLYRILADSAFETKNYSESLSHYLQAIPLIASHGGYGRYKLSTELLFLSSHMNELPEEMALSWINSMQELWSKLSNKNSDILIEFCNSERKKRIGETSTRGKDENVQ